MIKKYTFIFESDAEEFMRSLDKSIEYTFLKDYEEFVVTTYNYFV